MPAAATLAGSGGPVALLAGARRPSGRPRTSDGRFSVRVDQGLWDVGLVPPADAMLPRLWLGAARPEPGPRPPQRSTVPRGVMVHGVVDDPAGAPLAHADVRIYTVASGNGACAPTDEECLVPPRLRAESSSGADGVVSVILPSQPQ